MNSLASLHAAAAVFPGRNHRVMRVRALATGVARCPPLPSPRADIHMLDYITILGGWRGGGGGGGASLGGNFSRLAPPSE